MKPFLRQAAHNKNVPRGNRFHGRKRIDNRLPESIVRGCFDDRFDRQIIETRLKLFHAALAHAPVHPFPKVAPGSSEIHGPIEDLKLSY
eukprot:CAMPEP_0184733824 /NCGR_PEP_ID=MMETSP0314-20130426/58607_1 /TAXON_ID=38298 /ORGANISM="Rhodella maculata, Strain CCMP 736" /LENGTH=88 /DNA_ID=CAMNT_0027200701 /DNA_START=84 /DNA_END=350 /DNA_ORIENTATION=-